MILKTYNNKQGNRKFSFELSECEMLALHAMLITYIARGDRLGTISLVKTTQTLKTKKQVDNFVDMCESINSERFPLMRLYLYEFAKKYPNVKVDDLFKEALKS